jgi:hypothetical protein
MGDEVRLAQHNARRSSLVARRPGEGCVRFAVAIRRCAERGKHARRSSLVARRSSEGCVRFAVAIRRGAEQANADWSDGRRATGDERCGSL